MAGANSSGKSSIIQPLLLLKQTLEAGYDPGPLLLAGPHVRFSSGEQLLCKCGPSGEPRGFSIGIGVGDEVWTCKFSWKSQKAFELFEMIRCSKGIETSFNPSMTSAELEDKVKKFIPPFPLIEDSAEIGLKVSIARDRCFLQVNYVFGIAKDIASRIPLGRGLASIIRKIIHLPGLRGNPERTYPVTAVGETYQGTFQAYTASIIASWQNENGQQQLQALGKDMERLGLTWKVSAVRQNDTEVELQVGRLPHPARGGAHDLVSIADVGLGVSQTLPVLVALHVAELGQMVFLEQPEIHLHPRAQFALAEILGDAANRGVLVVAETHSSILLRGIQAIVAEGKLSPDKVSLNWFKRSEQDGMTEVVEGHFDKAGAFGDWPEDFDEVSLKAEARYLDAAESALQEKG
ncbi:MAG: AAA family ATPase [Verrucomicrobiota bacterium]